VTESDTHPAETLRAGLSKRIVALLICLAIFAVVLDQVTKTIVVATMFEGQVVALIPGVAEFKFVRNPGAAFSFASGQAWVFSLLAIVVTGVIVWVARRIRSRAWAVVFGLLLGGTLGNLIDRLFREPGFGRGYVIDFIYLPWMMPAIFNVADIAITTAAVVFAILILRNIGLDGKKSITAPRTKTPADE
jgi:signal peptidase II